MGLVLKIEAVAIQREGKRGSRVGQMAWKVSLFPPYSYCIGGTLSVMTHEVFYCSCIALFY